MQGWERRWLFYVSCLRPIRSIIVRAEWERAEKKNENEKSGHRIGCGLKYKLCECGSVSNEAIDCVLNGLMIWKILGERGMTIQQAERCPQEGKKLRMNVPFHRHTNGSSPSRSYSVLTGMSRDLRAAYDELGTNIIAKVASLPSLLFFPKLEIACLKRVWVYIYICKISLYCILVNVY